jgi:uncharacterized membrane protein
MYHLNIQWALLSDLHPAIVHFPIVLYFMALLFDILSYFRLPSIRRVSWWLLTGAVFTTGAAVLSGYMAESLVRWPTTLQTPIHRMTDEGWWTLGVGLIAWIAYGGSLRFPFPPLWMRATSTALLGLAVFFVARTTKIGGDMVLHPWLRMITPSRPQTLHLAWSMPEIFVGFGVVLVVGLIVGRLGWKYRHRHHSP